MIRLPGRTCPDIDQIIKAVRIAIDDMKNAGLDTDQLDWIEAAMGSLRDDKPL